MRVLDDAALAEFFLSLVESYDVLVPVALEDGTRSLAPPGSGPLALRGGALPAKPTAAFFPQCEDVFTARGTDFAVPSTSSKPLFVTGLTPSDIGCLRFIDRFFADGMRDDPYFRRRDGACIAAVSGFCGAGGGFLPPVLGGCDIELVLAASGWIVAAYTDAGREAACELAPTVSREEVLRLFPEQGEGGDGDILERASELLRGDRVPDTFWEEIADRCIACTTCNLVCPTCTCFGVEDRRSGDRVVRSRMWDSCQLDGFMREASGHNPLGTGALRTRRRIHHKLAADLQRWNEISCFLCGRCEAACPTGIGLRSVAREMVGRFGKMLQNREGI